MLQKVNRQTGNHLIMNKNIDLDDNKITKGEGKAPLAMGGGKYVAAAEDDKNAILNQKMKLIMNMR